MVIKSSWSCLRWRIQCSRAQHVPRKYQYYTYDSYLRIQSMWQFHVLEPSIHVWLVSNMCIQASHTCNYDRKHISVTHDTFLLITHWNSTSSLLPSQCLTCSASYPERSVVVLMLGRQLVTMLLSQGSQSAFGDTDHTIETVCLPHSYVPCATIKIPCV